MSTDRVLVQIEANEDANSVKDRLSFVRGQRILLIWPEEGTALTRKLDLVLIQREAMRRQLRLAIVTHDPQVIKHANELNISTFETIGASERGRWKRGRSKVFTHRWQRPKDEPEPDELMGVASRVRSERTPLSGLRQVLARFVLMAGLLVMIGGAGYVVVPSATVTLTPAQQRIEVSLDVTVSDDPTVTDIDAENAIIPSVQILVDVPEQQLSTQATGLEELGSTRAAGAVTFINTTSAVIEIPEGTIVTTTDGSNLTFATTEAASLPAGDGTEVDVPVLAMPNAAGDEGNVGENLINAVVGPLDEQVVVRNRTPTSGGQQQVVKVITDDDIDRLERLMYQVIQQRAYEEMPNYPGLTSRHVIIDQTVTVEDPRADWVSFSAEAGDQVDSVTMRMQALVRALAFDEQQAENLVYLRLSEQIPRGRVIQPETVIYERGPVQVESDGRIHFTITGASVVAGRIDEDLLRDQLAGLSLPEAEAYVLERVDIEPGSAPVIEVVPALFNRMPLWDYRIRFEITGPGTTGDDAPEEAATPEVTEQPPETATAEPTP